MVPPSIINQRICTNHRLWKKNQGSYHLLHVKYPQLMLCFFTFLNSDGEGKGHHQVNCIFYIGVHHQQKIRNLGTGGINFEPINLPVNRR